ncbi:ABC transporter permease subunit [Roseospira goensis]|uniref:Peptide/nickel transport system permease protein n=1 Tax=Roseospira goensis TaxID=391922 RepID=A0A7W6S3N2_9PROT|nr:peptide/nickel transport system permease protein [Roseospira goensis]
MLVYFIRRLTQSVVVVFLMAAIVFLGVYAIGNPIDVLINPEADQAERAAAIARLGLDKPLWEQFGIFLGNALQGDLGTSFVHGTSALTLILDRFPATFELAVAAMLMAILVGIPLGVIAGLYPDRAVGRIIMGGSILGFSLPTFWVGLMLIMVFAVFLGWLPAAGRGDTVDLAGVPVSFLTWDGLSHLFLPALNLALFKTSLVIRLARAGTREVMLQDYIKFARAKGLTKRRVVGVHVMKNIMIPVVTVLGLELGSVIAFAVVTETVFAWPGIGKLLIDSIGNLDRPVVVAYLMLTVFLFIVINFAVDVLYSILDPRVRLSDTKG